MQLNKLVNMPFRRRKATVWDKMRNMTKEELDQENEVQHIQYLLDHWILMRMENEIGAKEKTKKLNDKIMRYAETKRKATQIQDKYGRITGKIERVTKPGKQRFKYQEVLRRQEAMAEFERVKDAKKRESIKEAKFWEMQALLEAQEKEVQEKQSALAM